MQTTIADQTTELRFLGAVRIERDGKPVEGITSRKAVALLGFLAATGHPVTRDRLLGLFWGDKPETHARGNLRWVLHRITSVLPGCLDVERDTVRLSGSEPVAGRYRIDLLSFNRLASDGSPASLAAAAGLYRGDLMGELYLSDCPEFEIWLAGEQERWRLRVVRILHHLVDHHLRRGSFEAGLEDSNRLLALVPWQESAHRQRMRLLAMMGQRHDALAQYDSCRRVLAAQMGVSPDEETAELYRQIQAGEFPSRTETRRQDLPAYPTEFVGRDEEMCLIAERLSNPQCRLLSLVGFGGIGKTRLAVQAAKEEAGGYPDGVWFVSLDSQASPDLLASTLAQALGLALHGEDDPRRQLVEYLKPKEILLVLDGMDRSLAGTGLLADLLQQSPGLRVLATTRERLNLTGEWLLEVGGLKVPSSDQPGAPEEFSAIKLFAQSARRARPSVALSDAEKPAAIRICQMVAGMPLAIELAAAWVRVLSCEEIALEVQASLDFLNSSLQDLPLRHRSLRAIFDHTWSLLPASTQDAARRLSVFRGGFDRSAATQVAGALPADLAMLVDNSLLRAFPQSNGARVRFEMHPLLQQFTAEKIAEDPEVHEAARGRHCAYYAEFLGSRKAHLEGTSQREALEAIEAEIENVRAAWGYATTRGDIDAIALMLDSLFHFYDMRSWFREGESEFRRAGQMKPLGVRSRCDEILAKALARQAWFTFHGGDHLRARRLLQDSLSRLRELKAVEETVFCTNYLGAIALHLGSYDEARAWCQESLSTCRAIGDRYGAAIALNLLGRVSTMQGELMEARRHCMESLIIARELGNRWSMSYSLDYLGDIAFAQKDYDEAERLFRESLTTREAKNDLRGIANSLNSLGDTARAQGKHPEARHLYREGLATFRRIGNRLGASRSLCSLGHLSSAAGDYDAAWSHFYEALQVAAELWVIPRIMDVLSGMAALITQAGDHERGLELAALVRTYPSGEGMLAAPKPPLAAGTPSPADGMTPHPAETLRQVVEELLS